MGMHVFFSNTPENYYYLQRFRQGDEAALEYVYRYVREPLIHYGCGIIKDRFAVEDMVQDAVLKGWGFRENMESLYHIFCFMRLNLRWHCYTYYKVSRANPVFYTAYIDYYSGQEDTTLDCEKYEERVRLIEQAIPFLPANRQTIVTLYFKYGFSYKKIASRFNKSNKAVQLEVERSLDFLKKIILSQRKMGNPATKMKATILPGMESMGAEMGHIFKSRYMEKRSFAEIAGQMGLPVHYVQEQYVKAHQLTRDAGAAAPAP